MLPRRRSHMPRQWPHLEGLDLRHSFALDASVKHSRALICRGSHIHLSLQLVRDRDGRLSTVLEPQGSICS